MPVPATVRNDIKGFAEKHQVSVDFHLLPEMQANVTVVGDCLHCEMALLFITLAASMRPTERKRKA